MTIAATDQRQAPVVAAPTGHGAGPAGRRRVGPPWWFAVPALLLFAFVVLVPSVRGVYYAFTAQRAYRITAAERAADLDDLAKFIMPRAAGAGYGVNAKAKNKDLALKFVSFVMSPEGWTSSGRTPNVQQTMITRLQQIFSRQSTPDQMLARMDADYKAGA